MNEKTKPRIKKFTFFIGIDISKNKLDYAVLKGKNILFHKEALNNTDSITTFINGLKNLPDFSIAKVVFCMEHTGFYCNHLLYFLKQIKAHIVVENALQIKNSMGLLRGKYDKIDAIRIAQYAEKNRENLRFWQPRSPLIVDIASLFTLRNRMLSLDVMLKTPIKEQSSFIKNGIHKQSIKLCKKSMKAVKADIKNIDTAIDSIIASNERLARLSELIKSVPGVGRITAIQILISTNEFRDIRCPRKFACYAGVAPFRKESGGIKGRARVSPIANKKVKSLLHICAINAIRCDQELKQYYLRKTQTEGKPKMAVLNAVRNKLILRIFACLSQDRSFKKKFPESVLSIL